MTNGGRRGGTSTPGSTTTGMVVIRGRLSPEVGAVVRRALEAASDRLRTEVAPADAARGQHGPTPGGCVGTGGRERLGGRPRSGDGGRPLIRSCCTSRRTRSRPTRRRPHRTFPRKRRPTRIRWRRLGHRQTHLWQTDTTCQSRRWAWRQRGDPDAETPAEPDVYAETSPRPTEPAGREPADVGRRPFARDRRRSDDRSRRPWTTPTACAFPRKRPAAWPAMPRRSSCGIQRDGAILDVGAQDAHHSARATKGAAGARPPMPVPRLPRPALRCAPRPALGRRRGDAARQPRPALSPAPPGHPRGGLHGPAGPDRQCRVLLARWPAVPPRCHPRRAGAAHRWRRPTHAWPRPP